MVDTNATALDLLETTQRGFIRRVLGLGKRSILCVLFTETGLVPIKYRRLLLTIGYLGYLVSLPTSHYARMAFKESLNLDFEGYGGTWVGDLRSVVTSLPFPCPFPDHAALQSPDAVAKLASDLERGMEGHLHSLVEGSPKLYLLKGRKEPHKSSEGEWTVVPLVCRHYLHVANAEHRRALTRVIVSNHYYAVELLQYSRVPRAECFCRFCGAEVETPEHVLLQCAWNEEIVEARTNFVSLLEKECADDDIQRLRDVDGDCIAQLKALLGIDR
ncbi:hypothetical protein BKA70DRAFT_1260038 [Coprinopsis sp. MPI-PUGE-AT-0042]|nr:hypothetical protein BKA70DRAFT_1260038 [Coprinopsis sp. MPI-PUGE-AT-0042]